MDLFTIALLKRYVSESIASADIAKGKSAYEIAVDNGFLGSEEEWLNSLNGITPHIGENNHWFVGNEDTGVSATPNGEEMVALTTEEILEICK
jgi:hypothetical protein